MNLCIQVFISTQDFNSFAYKHRFLDSVYTMFKLPRNHLMIFFSDCTICLHVYEYVLVFMGTNVYGG